MSLVELSRKILSFDTSPTHGTAELVEWLRLESEARGLFVETQHERVNDISQANIIIRPISERPDQELLLQTHLDTQDPGPFGLWVENGHNPFDATIKDNRIYGLGAADVKLDFLCKLEALSQFPRNQKWRLPPVLVGTFAEEMGMIGTLRLIRKNKISTKMALIGEPSEMAVITAGQGIANVEIRIPYSEDEKNYRIEHNLRESTSTQSRMFNGKAAHSSMPHLGESAIKKMFDYLEMLPENIVIMEIDGGVNFNTVPAHAFLEIDPVSSVQDLMSIKLRKIFACLRQLESEFVKYTDLDFVPQHPTLNIGLIRTFDDHIFLSGSCRLPPAVSNEVYEEWMRSLKSTCEGVGGDLRIVDYKRPFRTDESSRLVRGCLSVLNEMDLPVKVKTQSSCNEASLWSRIGVECISFGPGVREGNIHTPQEHVLIDDLKKSIEFYRRVIGRFCI